MPLTINYLSRICTSKRKTIKDEPGFHQTRKRKTNQILSFTLILKQYSRTGSKQRRFSIRPWNIKSNTSPKNPKNCRRHFQNSASSLNVDEEIQTYHCKLKTNITDLTFFNENNLQKTYNKFELYLNNSTKSETAIKWRFSTPNLDIRDIVLIKEENIPF